MNKVFTAAAVSLFFIVCSFIFSSDISKIPAKPTANTFLVDTSGLISPDIEKDLNDRINLLNNASNSKLYLYITNKLSGYNAPSFLEQVMLTWGIKDNSNITAIIISLKDSKAYISSSAADFSSENKAISSRLGLYIEQQGYGNAVKYIYNTAANKIFSNCNYSFQQLGPVKEYRLFPYLITLPLIATIIFLSFFYFVSNPREGDLIIKNRLQTDSVLKTYLIKNCLIIIAACSFAVLYFIYSINICKLNVFFIFITFFILLLFPLMKDTISIILDLFSKDRLYIEGTVDKVFRTYFRYYFVIRDTSGKSFLASSNSLLFKRYNYISAGCTKKIKHITEVKMLYERIILN